MRRRNDILEAEGVVPDYENGIRITGPSRLSLCVRLIADVPLVDSRTLQIARVRD